MQMLSCSQKCTTLIQGELILRVLFSFHTCLRTEEEDVTAPRFSSNAISFRKPLAKAEYRTHRPPLGTQPKPRAKTGLLTPGNIEFMYICFAQPALGNKFVSPRASSLTPSEQEGAGTSDCPSPCRRSLKVLHPSSPAQCPEIMEWSLCTATTIPGQ
jgi:hypothetical protein